MSFPKTSLPDQLLANLYKDTIVLVDNEEPRHQKTVLEEPVTRASPQDSRLAYLGNNGKNISILVHDTVTTYLQDDLLEILSAIISACKLNLADVALVNTYRRPVLDQEIREQLNPQTVLLFGITTMSIDLPFSIPEY